MGSAQKSKLKFACSESWEGMLPVEKGRFCLNCEKTVIDFTAYDHHELKAYFRAFPNTCGQFRAEQVDPDLIPLSEGLRPIRLGLFAALTALSIQSSNAQGVAVPSIEMSSEADPAQVPHTNGKVDLNGIEIRMRADGPYCVKPEPKVERRRRYQVYLSRRFPFIAVHDRNRKGRYLVGF